MSGILWGLLAGSMRGGRGGYGGGGLVVAVLAEAVVDWRFRGGSTGGGGAGGSW